MTVNSQRGPLTRDAVRAPPNPLATQPAGREHSIMRALVVLLALSALYSESARAQVVRGTAITPDSALVPGVIVTLFDANGTAVARALAEDGGSFAMKAPSSGTYHIEAKRIAFRPTLDKPIVL